MKTITANYPNLTIVLKQHNIHDTTKLSIDKNNNKLRRKYVIKINLTSLNENKNSKLSLR